VLGLAALLLGQTAEESKDDGKKKDEGLPLAVAETLRFTTDEGTWLSLDLSPDGQTIVFDLLGDLYTMPAAGGKAKRIIGGLSFEAQPKFSPDGQWVVFTSDRSGAENLWMAKPDGSGIKAVTKGRGPAMQMYLSPAWTPDGEYVIAAKSERGIGTYHPYLYHRDGGTGVSIGPPPPPPPARGADGPPQRPPTPNKMGTVASKDGKYFYWAQRTGAMGYNATFPLWQIVRFDRNTGESVTLTNAPGSAMRPVLSPDGKSLVYATRHRTNTSLRVRDLETGEERWLIHGVTRDDQESRGTRDVFPGYAFFPDGRSLLVTMGGRMHRVGFATGKATAIPFTADVEAEIAPRVYS
jgi:Tol biopolymer transport system component